MTAWLGCAFYLSNAWFLCAICGNLEGSKIVGDKFLCCFLGKGTCTKNIIWFILLPYLDGGNWVDFRSLNVQVKVLRSTQLSFPVLFSSFSEGDFYGMTRRVPEWTTLNDPPGSSNVSWKLRHKVHIHIGKTKKISSQSPVCLHVFCLVLNSGSLNAQHLPGLNSPSDNPTHRPGVLVSGSSSSQCLKATLPSPKRARRMNYEEGSLSGK